MTNSDGYYGSSPDDDVVPRNPEHYHPERTGVPGQLAGWDESEGSAFLKEMDLHLRENSDNKSKGKPGPASAQRLLVTNITRRTVLGESIEVADSGSTRNKGLLGRSGLADGGGLWIVPCESVHTFWMKFPLDLIYIDRHYRVKKVRSNVPAWRVSACLRAHSVLELPAGVIKRSRTQPGDILSLSEP